LAIVEVDFFASRTVALPRLVLHEEAPLRGRVLEHRVRLKSARLQFGSDAGELLEGQVQVLAEHPPELARHLRPRLAVLRHEPEEDLVRHHLVLQERLPDIVLRHSLLLQSKAL
jgi:hypothetical protein